MSQKNGIAWVVLACGVGAAALAPPPAVMGGQAVLAADPTDPVERSRLREGAIATLLGLVNSEDAQVRANSIEGLLPAPARLEAVLGAALADENLGVRSIAAIAAGKAEMRSLRPALRDLQSDGSPYVRAAAIFALRRCGESVNPTPLGQLVTENPSAKVRAHAAFLLGELGDKGTLALLRDASSRDASRATAAENKVLQVQIAEALVKLGDDEQLHSIRAALYPSAPEELDATVLAVQVLGNLQDRASAGQLRNLANRRDPQGNLMPLEVRLAVAGALGAMGIPEMEGLAVESLRNGTLLQRMQAAWALGQIGTPGAVLALEAALADESDRVRAAAAAALLGAIEAG